MEYPKTLAAVASVELSLWPVVDALDSELATTPGGSVRNGEYERAADYLKKNGFGTWSPTRLRMLNNVGQWANSFARRTDFRRYPIEWVLEARSAARSDHAKALKILGEAKSKRDIRPEKPKLNAAQVIEALGNERIRYDVITSEEGLSLVQRAHMDAHAMHARPTDREPLPPAPRFAGAFWRAVQAIGTAHEELERGLGSLSLEPEAREAAERLRRQASEIAAAVIEAVVEDSIRQEV
jgi:hypothetical protein